MLISLIGLGLSAWLAAAEAPPRGLAAMLPAVTFNPRQRAVSNWRLEALAHLDPPLGVALPLLLGRDPRQVTRCVRLNNYWCIKRAGWAGEIAADTEDHVAFASALEGADVAALLLRRYYVGYGRHSAFAIISHWAPAGCGLPASAIGRIATASRMARSAADRLTTRGLGQTLRARFLSGRGRRVAAGGRTHGRPSVIPDGLIGARSTTPSIALGIGTGAVDLGTQSLASWPLSAMVTSLPARAAAGEASCIGDGVRIRNYAARAAAGVAQSADADLKLFDAAGLPTANLARVLANMSAVEIGPLGAGNALIEAAVDHARQVARGTAKPAPAAER